MSLQPTKPLVTALADARPAPNAFAAEADVRQIQTVRKVLIVVDLRKASLVLVLWGTLCPVSATAIDAFGLIGGINYSTWSSDSDNIDTSSREGLSIGGFASWRFSNNRGVLLEGLYSRKGADVTVASRSAYPNSPHMLFYRTTLDYLEFPALFEYNMELSTKVGAFMLVGPVISFQLGADME